VKILHTADWHMNDTLGRIDRSEDICNALRQIAAYLDTHQVDVMLVAGDVFEHGPLTQMRKAVSQVREIFLPFLRRGGTIVAISGNHDSEVFFDMLRDALDLVAPGISGPHGTDPTGRLYVWSKPHILKLADANGTVVQFVLMPYPTARWYLRGQGIQYRTTEEKHQAIQEAFTRALRMLEERLDQGLPSVLVSHIHVRGVRVHERYKLTEMEDVVFEPSDIPAHWAYVAYGHMHKPQVAVQGAAHVRYAGSIERLDMGDNDDQKSVVLCEIGPGGRVGESTILPLETTPIYPVVIRDPEAEISHLAERYANATNALVKYTLHWQPGKHNRDELCRQIESIFPRWYERDFKEIGSLEAAEDSFSVQHIYDVVGTVRQYLEECLADDADRDELLGLADQLLAEEVGS
jgi:exonuclease SbcD